MLFNTDKCKFVHFGYKNSTAGYSLGDVNIQTGKEETDLGIIIHQKCSLFSDLSNRCSGHVKLQLFRSPALASGSVSNHTP